MKSAELYPKEYLAGRGVTKKSTHRGDRMEPLKRFGGLKDYVDVLYYCIKCGQCRSTYQEKGRMRVCPSGELRAFEAYYLGGKNLLLWGLARGEVQWSDRLTHLLYHCTLCGNCAQQCQVPEIHYYALDWLEAAREEAVKRGVGPMPQQERYGKHTLEEYDPYMEPHRDRWSWLRKEAREELPEKADVVYFVGCTASYRQKSIAAATFSVLKKLEVDFTVLWRNGFDEWCCGSPLQRTGQVDRAFKLAQHNVEAIKKAGASLVVTSCAGCYRMIKEDYKERYGLDYGFEALHITSFLAARVKKEELKNEVRKRVTYHDPCHLGRHMGVYEEPRKLLRAIPGLELVEMRRIKENAWCCGAGGVVMSAFPDLARYASDKRIEEAISVGAELISSACPFCWRNLQEATERSWSSLKTLDVIELLWEAMK
ncbi:MAG: (Fe-S)-binding protein [Candidatus Nezhaarchaeota archaeon]|nr:(Fe-S)-binding protein [Candidatus Nezhaarchaeota archaeon]